MEYIKSQIKVQKTVYIYFLTSEWRTVINTFQNLLEILQENEMEVTPDPLTPQENSG